jgi:integrase
VVGEFLEEQKSEVGVNKIHRRYLCIKGNTKHLLGYVGENSFLLDIQSDKWKQYYKYRKKQKTDIVNGTLINEKCTIMMFYHFCFSKKYLPITYTPNFLKIVSENRRREHYTEDEWKIIWRFMRTNDWLKHDKPKIEEQRKFIRDYVITIINCGLRPSELRRIKWENVSVEQNEEKEPIKLSVRIKLDRAQTKNKKPRVVIGRRGDVFHRIRSYSNFTKPTDFVFVNNDTGGKVGRNQY